MARMYSRRKGKSKSTKPLREKPPEWVEIEPEKVEELALELYNGGYSTSQIGMVLRDQYGVPDVKLITGKKITTILENNDAAPNVPEDIRNLIVKALRLRKHVEKNPKDLHNKRALQLTESKVRRLVKYYCKSGELPADWTYKPETAEMLITR